MTIFVLPFGGQGPHSGLRGTVIALCLRIARVAGLLLALVAALALSPAFAQADLRALVDAATSGSLRLPAEGTAGRADFDQPFTLAGDAASPPVLTAPGDDAILVVHAGATLTVSDVVLKQEGANRFGAFVNGGTLVISGCRIEGAFEVGIYVASGSLALSDCAIAAEGGDGIAVATADRIDIADYGATGVAEALIVQQAAAVDLQRFDFATSATALSLSGVSGSTRIGLGRIAAPAGAYGAQIGDIGSLEISALRVTGGDVGLFLFGNLPEASVVGSKFIGQSQFGIALQDIAPGGAPPRFADNFIVAGPDAIGFFGAEAGPLEFSGNRVVAAGVIAAQLQGGSFAPSSGNVFVARPARIEGHVVLRDPDAGSRIFLPAGAVEPIGLAGRPGADDIVLSHAELAGTPSLDDPSRRAIARFAASGDAGLATDLDLALLDIGAAGAASAPAIRLDLAPPAEGWVWAPRSVVIGLEPVAGAPRELRPADFPVAIAPGQYRLLVDGQLQRVVALDADQTLTLAMPPGPFLVARSPEGVLMRGPTFALRPGNTLAALHRATRPPAIGEFYGARPVPVARPGIDAAAAAARLAEIRAGLPGLLDRRAEALAAKDWPAYDRLSLIRRLDLALVAELGTAADAGWLVETLAGDRFSDIAIEALVRLEQRLGPEAEGVALRELGRRLATDPAGNGVLTLAEALARTGDRRGMAALVALRAGRSGSGPNLDGAGLATLFLVPEPEVLDHYRDFLRSVRDRVPEILSSPTPSASAATGGWVWLRVARAITLLSAHGTSADAGLFDLPVPADGSYEYLLPLVADPATMIEAWVGNVVPIAQPGSSGWSYRFGELLCPALTLRGPAFADTLHLRALMAMREAIIREIATDYWERSADRRGAFESSLRFASELSVSHCRLNGSTTELALSESAAEEERRKFGANQYDPDWWLRPERARMRVEALAAGGELPGLGGLSPFPPEAVEAWLGPDPATDPELLAAFRAHHRFLTDAFQPPQWLYDFGAERRIFRLRNGTNGGGTLSMQGFVDMRPLLEEGALVIALRAEMISPDYGGIAAAMSASDRTPFETNDRLGMFDSVALERDGETLPADYLGSTEEGVHLFRVPFDGDFSRSYVRLGLRHLNAAWSLDFPLYQSHAGFLARAAATPFVAPEAVP